MRVLPLATVLFGALATVAHADPLTPTFDEWGDLQDYFTNTVTFTGTDIPTGPGAITQFEIGTDTLVTLGLSITPRFSSPDPVVTTPGTYAVETGVSTGSASLWNFSFAAEIVGTDGMTFDDFDLRLAYEMDPALNTDASDFGFLDLGMYLASVSPGLTFVEGSQNLSFEYLAGMPAPLPWVSPPSYTGFDATVAGQYGFGLAALRFIDDIPFGGIAGVIVNAGDTTSPVPLPAGLPLLLAGLGGLYAVRRRRRGA